MSMSVRVYGWKQSAQPTAYGPNSNWIIQDYNSFVSAYFDEVWSSDDFQSVQPRLEMRIRIPYDFYPIAFGHANLTSTSIKETSGTCLGLAVISYSEAVEGNASFSYTYRYFITGANRKVAEKTCELNLRLDTLNTIQPGMEQTETTLGNKVGAFTEDCLVKREHRDRNVGVLRGIALKGIPDVTMIRSIDKESESMSLPLYPSSRKAIEEEDELTANAGTPYLLYKTDTEDPTKLAAYIAYSNGVVGDIQQSFAETSEIANAVGTTTSNSYSRYIFWKWMNPNLKQITAKYSYEGLTSPDYTFDLDWPANAEAVVVTIIYWISYNLGVANYQTAIYVTYVTDNGTAFGILSEAEHRYARTERLLSLDLSVTTGQYWLKTFGVLDTYWNPKVDSMDYYEAVSGKTWPTDYTRGDAGTATTKTYVASIAQVGRYDSRNVKLIQTPYSPVTVTEDDFGIASLRDFAIDAQSGLAKGEISEFAMRRIGEALDMDSQFFVATIAVSESNMNASRNDIYESKLWNSAFHQVALVYDSYSMNIALERFSVTLPALYTGTGFTLGDLPLYYKQSANISSKFLVSVKEDPTDFGSVGENGISGVSFEYWPEDNYPYGMVCARNNEEPIYTSEYLNYIRNGYNYDLKASQRANLTSWLNVGTAAVTTGATTAMSVATGVGTIFAAQAAGGLASSLVNAIQGQQAREDQINRTLQTKALSSIGVSGSDDLDLMRAYSGNKVWTITYDPSPRARQLVADLFHYCGYSTNVYKRPSVHTRANFNYLQGSMNFRGELLLGSEITNDLKSKFESGVWYYWHCAASDGSFDFWDFEMVRANFELKFCDPTLWSYTETASEDEDEPPTITDVTNPDSGTTDGGDEEEGGGTDGGIIIIHPGIGPGGVETGPDIVVTPPEFNPWEPELP